MQPVSMDEPKVEVEFEKLKEEFKAEEPKAAAKAARKAAPKAAKVKAEPKAVKRKVKVEHAGAPGAPAKKAKGGAVVEAKAMVTTVISTRVTRSSTRRQTRGV
jgi:hypothetical protein